MVTFVVLRIESDDEARRLVEDMAEYPGPLLTPILENEVYATVESSAVGAWDDVTEPYRPEPGDRWAP